jgi:transposase
MSILYVGVDVGNMNSQVFAFTEDGEVVVDRRLRTLCENSWVRLLEKLSASYEVWVAYEVGPHYEWMQELFERYCSQVVLVNPADFGVISKSQKKTDRHDAQKLAEGVRRGDLPEVFAPPKQSRADRRLVSFVHWHSRREGSAKTRLRGLLMTYRLRCPHSDISSPGARRWFKEEATGQMDEQGRCVAQMLLDELSLLKKQRAQLDKEVEGRLGHYGRAAEVLHSVPGFGPLTVLALVSMIVDIGRFGSAKELSAYFGACGKVYQSGKTLRLGAVTKRGNKTVRWLLSQALCSLHRADARARKRYLRLKRRKHNGVARSAQVNWLVGLVYYLLKTESVYRRKAA